MRRSRTLLVLPFMAAACNALSGVGDLETTCTEDCGTPSAVDATSDASLESAPRPDASDASTSNDADAKPVPLCDPTDTSLIFCLPFDGNAIDGSGNPLVGAATGVTYGPGHVAQGAFFTNGSVAFPYAPKLDVNAATIEAFIAPTSLPPAGTRMGIVDSEARFGMFLAEGTMECRSGGGVNLVTAPTPSAGKVSHVACVADGVVVTAYINGVQAASMNVPTPIPKTTGGVVIGRNDPSGDFFAGMIDELRIYNRARSAAEIAADAARGK